MDGGARRDGYSPALDGLRAVAVVAVVLFHCDARWARGGFLGVSLFFTLSGFLITRLLIAEHARTGRIALGAFWARRVRRLAPAALLCLALVLATSRWLLTPAEIQPLRGDITAAAASVANWRFLSAGDSYAALFAGRPSPVLHFWSLAIEEQFYFVFPCIVALLLWRRSWLLPAGLALLASASLGSSMLASDHDLIYYGTHTRAVELLVGALLACLVRGRRLLSPASPAPGSHVLTGIALASTATFVLLAITTEQTEQWLYRGGFAALALLWCPMILAAATSRVFARLFGASLLAALGRRSYGVYVFHWPVFTMVTPRQLHLDGWIARACQLAIIAALTEVSFRIVERPIRERRLLTTGPAVRAAAIAAIGAIVVTAVAVPAPRPDAMSMVRAPDAPVLFADGATPISVSNATAMSVPPSVAPTAPDAPDAPVVPDIPATTTTALPPPTRVVVVGSAPEVVEVLRAAASGNPSLEIVDQVRPGCSVIDFADGVAADPSCAAPLQSVPPGVLIVAIGATDHGAVNDRIHASDPASLFAVAQQLRRLGVDTFARYAQQAGRVIVVDSNMELPGDGDLLTRVLTEADVSTTTLTVRHVTEVDAAFIDGLAAPAPPPGLRVMVIGDSTSYGVADGLAHSGLPLVVLWAGHRNCPLIPVDTIDLFDQEFSVGECPSVHAGWPEQLASFRPDVVLAVDSVPEQAPQRYAGDDTWHEPGDAVYTERHDAGMYDLLNLIAPSGAVLLLATSPANAADNGAKWSSDERIAAWNAQLASLDALWAPIALIDYGALVLDAEAAAGHTLRPDGVHLDDVSVHSIVGGSLGPQLLEQVATLRAQLQATGCLADGADGPQLALAACAG